MATEEKKPPKGKKKSWKSYAIYVGVGVGGFLIYRWYQSRSSSSSSSAGSATTTGSSGGSGSGSGGSGSGYGGGSGSGGGGAGAGYGAQNNSLLNQLLNDLTSGNPSTGHSNFLAPAPTPSLPSSSLPPTPSTPTPTPTTPTPTTPSSPTPGTTVEPVPVTSTPRSAVKKMGTFKLKKGTVNFAPTVSVRHGNQVAYGIGNPGTAKKISSAGGTVISGKALAAKGWTHVTPGADYLLR